MGHYFIIERNSMGPWNPTARPCISSCTSLRSSSISRPRFSLWPLRTNPNPLKKKEPVKVCTKQLKYSKMFELYSKKNQEINRLPCFCFVILGFRIVRYTVVFLIAVTSRRKQIHSQSRTFIMRVSKTGKFLWNDRNDQKRANLHVTLKYGRERKGVLRLSLFG